MVEHLADLCARADAPHGVELVTGGAVEDDAVARIHPAVRIEARTCQHLEALLRLPWRLVLREHDGWVDACGHLLEDGVPVFDALRLQAVGEQPDVPRVVLLDVVLDALLDPRQPVFGVDELPAGRLHVFRCAHPAVLVRRFLVGVRHDPRKAESRLGGIKVGDEHLLLLVVVVEARHRDAAPRQHVEVTG